MVLSDDFRRLVIARDKGPARLLCFWRPPECCHRNIVTARLAARLGCPIARLGAVLARL